MKFKNKKLLLKKFGEIEDFRNHKHKIKYPLNEILFMTLFALLQGQVTFNDIHSWILFNANKNRLFNKLFNKKEIKTPSRSTLHRMLINVDNNSLELIFREYFKKYSDYKDVAVDGKWLNGSDINGQYTEEPHKAILNIFDKNKKIVLGHKLLDKNTRSEIPAFTEVLKEKLFYEKSQIFSFDALLTQINILTTIENQNNKYIAKVKGNQKLLKENFIFTANNFHKPSETYTSPMFRTENNKSVTRIVDIFYNKNCDIVMYHKELKNIQTIIKVTKELIDLKTGVIKRTTEYLIANFKISAEEFHNKILEHWGIETYHYHLDKLTCEDKHVAYLNPFSMAILRSFTINFYQLFLNSNKNIKLMNKKISMAGIKKLSSFDKDFTSDLFEI